MLCTIHRTHFLLLPHDDLRTCYVLFSDRGVLRALEAVEEVCAEGAVEVHLETVDNGWRHEGGIAEAVEM